MRGLNEDEVCNFVALTQDKVSLGSGNTAGRLSQPFSPSLSTCGSFHKKLQSCTQSPSEGSLASGWSPGETLGNSKQIKFFDWLPCNGLHCFTAEILW